VGLAVSPTSRLRASDTQFECFVETARRVAAG
ncbi:LysR family transcriptional regulator, partial [Pseudomonas aeruginosa]|nr:LysR family transcriptional regulator [Pseudomonas aeruginosa]